MPAIGLLVLALILARWAASARAQTSPKGAVPIVDPGAGRRSDPCRCPASGTRAGGRSGPTCRALNADPLPHRDRLSAVQLRRARRQSAGLQRRSRPPDVRGAEDRLHRPDAPVRDAAAGAQREPRRRRDRLDRRRRRRRAPRSISPIPITARRRASWRKRDSSIDDALPEKLEGRKVAVVAGTAHEAYLKALFTEVEVRSYPNADVARLALRRGDVDLLFGDAISLAFWLNGTDSDNCCAFRGGPFIDSRYFGEGVGIAVKRGNDTIRLGAQLGAVPAVGAGPLHRPVAALFPDQPVLRRIGAGSGLTRRGAVSSVRAPREPNDVRPPKSSRPRCASSPSNRTPGRSRRRARSSRGSRSSRRTR